MKSWLVLLMLAVTWGSSYILIARGLDAFSAEHVAALRVTLSGMFFLPIAGASFNSLTKENLKYVLVVSFVGSGIPAFLFAFAQTQISSSLTGVLSSLTPLCTLLLGILFFRVEKSWVKYLGVALGLIGAVMLILLGKKAGLNGSVGYALLVVLATLGYGISTNTIKAHLYDMNPLHLAGMSFLILGGIGFVFLLFTNFISVMQEVPGAWAGLGYVGLLAFFGTVIGSIFYFQLVQRTSALFASTVSYLTPIVAIFWGFLDGEIISWVHFAGMTLILSGIYLTRK